MNQYECIDHVIRYMDEACDEHPDLAEVAEQLELSLNQMEQLFLDWAGSTPAEFFRCLRLAGAKEKLGMGHRVLDLNCLDAGVANDLKIRLEVAGPDVEEGLVTAGFSKTPFGISLLAEHSRGICFLSFIENKKEAWEELQAYMPKAQLTQNDSIATKCSEQLFNPIGSSKEPLSVVVKGTEFQVQVWRALLRIPVRAFVSYGHLAAATGHSSAARAVGTAVGKNPIAYIIPCHRVIRENGSIGGYRGGIVRKRAILAWEELRSVE